MDPTACFQRMLTAILEHDKEEALSAADDLAGWLARGGFEPTWTPDDRELFPTIHKALRRQVRQATEATIH